MWENLGVLATVPLASAPAQDRQETRCPPPGYFPVRVSPGLCRRPRPGSDLARSASLLSHVNAEPDLGPRFPHRLCLVAVAPVQLLGGFEGDRGEILEIRARGDVVQALDPDPALAGPICLLLNPVALG